MFTQITRVTLPNNWQRRPYQDPLWQYLRRGGTRADVAWHRRAGKDDVALHWTAIASQKRIGTYWHLLPEASQARKAIWEAINSHTGKRRIDEAFPRAMIKRMRDNDMMIEFHNGSIWQVVGSDNFNSLVGSPPVGVVFSEWALAKPDAWSYIRPILLENGGWALFIWTPRGRNHATRAHERREHDPEWFTERLSATKTGIFTPTQLARELKEMTDELGSPEEAAARFASEYLVDFDAATPGSYFAAQLNQARLDKRIGRVRYDPAYPVLTSWDIGVDDYSAIWFFQDDGRWIRAIDYYETTGDGPEQIVAACMPELLKDPTKRVARLLELGRQPYSYGGHYLPHDIMVREWGGGGKSRLQTLRDLGFKNIHVGVQQDPAERINAARRMMAQTVFDAIQCQAGLDRLRNYRKRWNAALKAYTGPLHDENSHGADAFGEFAVNRQQTRIFVAPKLDGPQDYRRPKPKESGMAT